MLKPDAADDYQEAMECRGPSQSPRFQAHQPRAVAVETTLPGQGTSLVDSHERLIATLSARLGRRPPLRNPAGRVASWFTASSALGAVVIFVNGLRPDIADMLADPTWLAGQAAIAATAAAMACGAVAGSIPGGTKGATFAWLLPVTLWLFLLARLDEALTSRSEPLELLHLFCPDCVPYVFAGSTLLLLRDLRKAAPMAPRLMAAMSVAGGGAFAFFVQRLIHDDMDALPIISFQVAFAALLGGFLSPGGTLLFRFPTFKARN